MNTPLKWLCLIWLGAALSCSLFSQSTQKIVITGSVLNTITEKPVAEATVVFQLDSIRFAGIKTDAFGFFLFYLNATDVGKNLQFFISHPDYQFQPGESLIQSMNDPIIIRLTPNIDRASTELVELRGRILDPVSQLPIPEVHLRFRIGNVILPDSLSDARGEFAVALLADDVGRVVTYRLQKEGYAPRYGYLPVEPRPLSSDLTLEPLMLTVSGYVKNVRNNKPVEQAKVILALKKGPPVTKTTSGWGFFTHSFASVALEDTLRFKIEKAGFYSTEGTILPRSDEELRLNFKMRPIQTEPFYKNKYFLIGSAGAVALITSIIIYHEIQDDLSPQEDLPLPPRPPGTD